MSGPTDYNLQPAKTTIEETTEDNDTQLIFMCMVMVVTFNEFFARNS